MKPCTRTVPVSIVGIWLVSFLALILYAFFWYTCGWIFIQTVFSIDSSLSFSTPVDAAATFVKYVVVLNPVFVLIGVFFWAYNNSRKRDSPYG